MTLATNLTDMLSILESPEQYAAKIKELQLVIAEIDQKSASYGDMSQAKVMRHNAANALLEAENIKKVAEEEAIKSRDQILNNQKTAEATIKAKEDALCLQIKEMETKQNELEKWENRLHASSAELKRKNDSLETERENLRVSLTSAENVKAEYQKRLTKIREAIA